MNVIITEENANERIDIALSKATEFSRSMIQKMIYAKKITLNKEFITKANHITELGNVYEIEAMEKNIDYIQPEDAALDILFEDEHLMVLNKPYELIVHPGAGNPNGTLINKIAGYLAKSGQNLSDHAGAERLGVVHRLDKGVSGCIIIAKTNQAHIHLANQFQERSVSKKYLALCYQYNNIPESGIMEDYLARGNHDRKKIICIKDAFEKPKTEQEIIVQKYALLNKTGQNIFGNTYKAKAAGDMEDDEEELPNDTKGKYAKMEYLIKEKFESKPHNIVLVECKLHTGRMHQIRVQLSSRGMPIIGDLVYGKKFNAKLDDLFSNRIALHAYELGFIHPISKQEMVINAKLPDVFAAAIKLINN